MIVLRVGLLALLVSACARAQSDPPVHIDHIIVGIDDLVQGMAEIERLTGVRPAIGGAHPGAGTQNALLSLGKGTYLEIYAPNPAEPVMSAEIAQLRALKRPIPIGWAVSADDTEALRATMKSKSFELTPSNPGSRRKPDGTLLSWVTFGFVDFNHPLAPFFIHWTDPTQHPSRTSPHGCKLRSITIQDPAAGQLRRAIEPLGLKIAVVQATRSGMKISLSCPRGAVTFG